MKAVFVAGGFGTRLSEETAVRPKPMVEVGGRPILWHIMKTYSAHGVNDFVVCLGYKAEVVKDFFLNYHLRTADLTVDLAEDRVEIHHAPVEPWRVTLVDTGPDTMTGGRLKRVASEIGAETFCFAYGDCVSDVDITRLVQFHREQGVVATVTAIHPPGRFGALALEEDDDRVGAFREKPAGHGGWVNGGFFVLEPSVFDYISGDETVWEREPLERLAADGELAAYRHRGYWQNMDTLRDKMLLEEQWATGAAPWKVW